MIIEVFAPGMTAMAAPVRAAAAPAIGVVTIAGPLVRLTEERMLALGPRAAGGGRAAGAGQRRLHAAQAPRVLTPGRCARAQYTTIFPVDRGLWQSLKKYSPAL